MADPETEKKIAQLQMLEQNIQSFASQRQQFQMHVAEIEHALKELKTTTERPFRVLGQLMVAADKDDLTKELTSQKEVSDIRIKSLEKQEQQLKEKAEALQQEVLSALQKKGVK